MRARAKTLKEFVESGGQENRTIPVTPRAIGEDPSRATGEALDTLAFAGYGPGREFGESDEDFRERIRRFLS